MKTPNRTSVAKAFGLLELVGKMSQDGGARLRDLVKPSNLSKPTVFRLLLELQNLGFVEQDKESKRYRLGQKIHILSAYHDHATDLRRRALPHLRELTHQTGLASHLAVRDGLEVIYIEKVEADAQIRITSGVGWRAPLYCTSLGKAILAHSATALLDEAVKGGFSRRTDYTITSPSRFISELAEIREVGYAVDDRENELEVRCIGAPVFNRHHEVVAAISISGLVRHINKRNIPTLGRRVMATCDALAAELGYVRRSPDEEGGSERPSLFLDNQKTL